MIGEEIFFTKEILPNHSNPNCFSSKYHNDNAIDNNRNIGNRLGNKKSP